MEAEVWNEAVTIGRIVEYVLSDGDAEAINRRRTDGRSIAERIRKEGWPIGAQAHIGNVAVAGRHCPAMVVAVHQSKPDEVPATINLQVMLDGNDVFWAQNVENDGDWSHGTWHWPERRAK